MFHLSIGRTTAFSIPCLRFRHNTERPIAVDMGNTITLLGLGKKIFMRSDITPWAMFDDLGVSIFDLDQLDINKLSADELDRNAQIISEHFSEVSLRSQIEEVFR